MRVCLCYRTMQSKLDAFFAPPAAVRGMRQLDRAAFRREVTLPAVFLQEHSLCAKFLRRLDHVVLKYPRIKKIHQRRGEGDKVGPSLSENEVLKTSMHTYYNGCAEKVPSNGMHSQGVAKLHLWSS